MAVATVKASKASKNTKATKAVKKAVKAVAVKVAPKATTKSKGKSNGIFTNPYRVGSSYFNVVESLRNLGMNTMHPQDKVIAAVRKAMGDEWKAFAAKGKRNDETGKDAEARVWQNCSVVARVKDYGKPLVDAGFVVKFDGREKVCGLYKL